MPHFSTRTVGNEYLFNYSGLQLGKGKYRRIPLLHCIASRQFHPDTALEYFLLVEDECTSKF